MKNETNQGFSLIWLMGTPLALKALLLGGVLTLPNAGHAQAVTETDLTEEIVVTARRREERLIDAPLSVSVFDENLLIDLHVSTIDEISHQTPGLIFDTTTSISGSPSSASVFIRGIGQTDFTLVTEPGVGIYIDDIYLPHSIGNVVEALNLERVEVLKGPQGTLFGRNTIGGAVRVVTRKPHSDGFEGDIDVTIGNYNRIDVKGHVNVPVTDNFALRFSALTQNWDGFVDRPNLGDSTGNKNARIFAVQARWQSESFTADFLFNTVKDRSAGAPNVLLAAGNGAGNQGAGVDVAGNVLGSDNAPLANTIAERLATQLGGTAEDYVWNTGRVPTGCSARNAGNCLEDTTNLRIKNDLDADTIGLTIGWEISDSVSLKFITGYRELDTNFGRDGDHSIVPVISVDSFISSKSFSQEVQLSGTSNRLSWLLGVYYFNEDGFMDDDVRFNNFSLLSGGAVETESTAVFAQATWSATEQLDLTFGIRYTDETKVFTMDDEHQALAGFGPSDPADAIWWLNPSNTPVNTNYGFLLNFRNPTSTNRVVPGGCGNLGTSVTFECKLEEDRPDYHAGLAWRFRTDQMLYANYSTGFKGGGFQQRNANLAELPIFKAEQSGAFEVGYKASLSNGRVSLAVAYFRTDYTDFQATVTEGDGQGVSVTRNAGDALIQGVELDLTLTPVDSLRLVLSLAYLQGEYKALSDEAIKGGITTDHELLRLPELQTSVSATYDFRFANGSVLIPRVDWSHSGEMYNDAVNSKELKRTSYNLINLSLTYENKKNDMSYSVFWKNITDEQFVTSGFYGTPSPGAPLEYVDGSISRPSEWGVQIRKMF